jgi:hypothetical protein
LMNVAVRFLFAAIIPNIAAFPRFSRNCACDQDGDEKK